MKFRELPLPGAWLIEPERINDARGFFARVFCEEEFARHGLETRFVQSSISFNRLKGTLRGLHWQAAPHEEVKLVRCTAGAIFDVIVDLRPGSASYRKWTGVELSADNRRTLYVPKGFAHGFQTCVDDSEVHYQISAFHRPDSARGLRWDDPAIDVRWPASPTCVSEKDAQYPLLGGGGAS
jgi:dTDP-4-dehydrorhamnose 3,5-epimerase